MKKIKLENVIGNVGLFTFLLTALFPIYWMINTSFKNMGEIYKQVPTFWPQTFTMQAYTDLFTKSPFLNSVKNSLIVGLAVASFSIIIALPAAYAIARLKFRGRRGLSRSVLFTYLVPASVLYIPLFIMVSKLGLTNSLFGLMIIYPTFTIPYVTWILIPYIQSIPIDIEEAAIIDGCSRLQSLVKMIIPLAIPGIVTTFIFAFTMCWGEYLYALVINSKSVVQTFPLVIAGLIFADMYPWGQMMAGAVFVCIPVLLLYSFASNYVVKGMAMGSVKQ